MASLVTGYTRQMSETTSALQDLETILVAARKAVVELGVQAEWVEGINDHGAGPASDRAGEIRDCGYHSIQNVRDVILLAEEARRKLRWIANERKLDHMRLVGLLEAMEAALDTNR